MFAKAQEILGYDLLKVCLEGPKAQLDDTQYSQPALFVAGLAAVEKLKAENPAAAAKMGDPHGMLTIVGLGDADLEDICKTVRDKMPGKTCQLANFLFPQGRVCSGHKDALDEVQKLATAAGALKAQAVAVSGAFHTGLMR